VFERKIHWSIGRSLALYVAPRLRRRDLATQDRSDGETRCSVHRQCWGSWVEIVEVWQPYRIRPPAGSHISGTTSGGCWSFSLITQPATSSQDPRLKGNEGHDTPGSQLTNPFTFSVEARPAHIHQTVYLCEGIPRSPVIHVPQSLSWISQSRCCHRAMPRCWRDTWPLPWNIICCNLDIEAPSTVVVLYKCHNVV
jgi:hypothetical protein